MNEIDNNNTSKFNNKRLRITFSIVVLLSICFAASYLITDYLTNPNKKRVEATEEDRNVLNQNGIYLSNDVKVTLKDSENTITKKKLSEIKGEFNLPEETTKERLVSILKEKGYNLEEEKENELVFQKDLTKTVEANKYFLGEFEGNIVVYKSNENGKLEKVDMDLSQYRLRKVESLSVQEQEMIRNNDFIYESLDAAMEAISGYSS